MFFKIKDTAFIAHLSKNQNMINVKKTNFEPKGEYLITYSMKNAETVKLIFIKYQNKNYTILYKLKTNEYYILQLRFTDKIFNDRIELLGDLKDNILYIHLAYIERTSLVDNLQLLDTLLYTDYKEDLEMENIQIKIKEFYSNIDEIKSNNDMNINGILYLNNYLDKQHFIMFL